MTNRNMTAEQKVKREEDLRIRSYELALQSERHVLSSYTEQRPLSNPNYIANAEKIYNFIKGKK